jgi:hypothetical protein
MEDVLDLYAQPVDSKRPLVCFDERLCHRNQNQVCADWRFRTSDARVKLSKIYPTQQN